MSHKIFVVNFRCNLRDAHEWETNLYQNVFVETIRKLLHYIKGIELSTTEMLKCLNSDGGIA